MGIEGIDRADFNQQHWSALCELLELPANTQIPSYSTFRRILHRVDFKPFASLFNRWSQMFLKLTEETGSRQMVKALKVRSTITASRIKISSLP